jgi:catechol 2,3-dioxygenase-like lactoylglutathione lyase family enzyme
VVKTFGLTHIALAVKDPERSLDFYHRILGSVPVYRAADFIQAQTPGSRDVLVFERGPGQGRKNGVRHFGFRLTRPSDITKAVEAITAAGGRIRSQGEFCPGEPYVFFTDPDGYEVEIWYEIPTPADPRPARSRRKKKRSS